ncbi:hypothetical protein HY491_00095 [Candidatus Woesearchaeota archaeon]|nr:hypothetical protein [Candidatus Woesearchaeota archaeon]
MPVRSSLFLALGAPLMNAPPLTCYHCGKEIPSSDSPQVTFVEKSDTGEIALSFCSDQCLVQWIQKRPHAIPPVSDKLLAPVSVLEENLLANQEPASVAEHIKQPPFPAYQTSSTSSYIIPAIYPDTPPQAQPTSAPDLIAKNLKSLDQLSGEVQYVEHHAVRQRLKYRIRPKTLFERLKDRLKAVGIIPYDRDNE